MDAYADVLSLVSPVLADLVSVAKQGPSGGMPELKCTEDSAEDWSLLLDLVNPALRARLPDNWVRQDRAAPQHTQCSDGPHAPHSEHARRRNA